MFKKTRTLLLCVAAVFVAACTAPTDDGDAASNIREVMLATWDRPDAPLTVNPIVVSGDHAVADWTQGAQGGRALLRQLDGVWSVVLCAGDGIRSENGLRGVGLPHAVAQDLATQLARAERTITPERLRLMASFEGVVRMDAQPISHDQDQGH